MPVKIKRKLPLDKIEQIEKEFIDSGMIYLAHDGSGGASWYDAMNKEEARKAVGKLVGVKVPSEQRKFFTKSYEVYTNPKAKKLLSIIRDNQSGIIEKFKAQGDLFLLHQSFVILAFDYRNNTGKIELEVKEFPVLVKFFPVLNCVNGDK
jgi:hypothetical protein